jgi:hypothetical protein
MRLRRNISIDMYTGIVVIFCFNWLRNAVQSSRVRTRPQFLGIGHVEHDADVQHMVWIVVERLAHETQKGGCLEYSRSATAEGAWAASASVRNVVLLHRPMTSSPPGDKRHIQAYFQFGGETVSIK